MKIIFFARRYWPHVGGVETHLQGIIPHLQKKHQITVITEQFDHSLKEHEKKDGVEIFRIPVDAVHTSKTEIWLWLGMHSQLLDQADVFHVHDVFFWILPYLWRYRNTRLLTTFHGYEAPGMPNLKQIFWHQVADVLSDKTLAVGGFHHKWYGVDADIVTYGGVKIPTSSLTKTGSKRAVFIGRLAEDTGIRIYLAAFRCLAQQKSGWQLDVYGAGDLEEECRELVKKYALPVHFLGAVPDAQQKLANYSVACVSGYLTILAALAQQVPVCSTYHHQLKKDYLLNTPFAQWITVSNEPEELAKKISQPRPVDPAATNWAKSQTWSNLAGQYESLWSL